MKFRICVFSILLFIIISYVDGCRKAGLWFAMSSENVHADDMEILIERFSDRIYHAVDL